MKSRLSKSQVICIVLLWLLLCVMLFVIPSSSSLGEKIFIALVSGGIIGIAISKDRNRIDRTRRRK